MTKDIEVCPVSSTWESILRFVIWGLLVQSPGEAFFSVTIDLGWTLSLLVICFSLLIQKSCGISSWTHVEKLVITGLLSREARRVDQPPRYDQKRCWNLWKTTHKHLTNYLELLFQKTATKAVISLPRRSKLDAGFQLFVYLAEVHVPRMWVEKHPTNYTQVIYFTLFSDHFTFAENDKVIWKVRLVNSCMKVWWEVI